MTQLPIVKEILLNAPVDIVWRAITDPEEFRSWYFDIPVFKAETGFQFHFYGENREGKKYKHLSEVKEVVPMQKLSYSWKYEGYEGDSLVTFELFPEGEQTLLRLIHTGLDTFPDDNTDFAPSNFEGGWEAIICESLKNALEQR